MSESFDYPPSPAVLQALSAGQLASRWQRSLRLWWLLRSLYGQESPWRESLPHPFRYGDLRAKLFAPTHSMADQAAAKSLGEHCQGSQCLCQRSLATLLEAADSLDWADWQAAMAQQTGMRLSDWEQVMLQAPFAVGHRSIRDDLKALVEMGWLQQAGRGQFARIAAVNWPPLPVSNESPTDPLFSREETWELLKVLEEIAFVQPQLNVVIDRLWQRVTHPTAARLPRSGEKEKRIFLHLDYILPPEMQEQVDNLQYDIEQLWQQPEGGVIQFEVWMARQERQTTVTVYPVCLHYARRAKYLSAYGVDPEGQIAWHNYRLDRIVSERVKVLPWADSQVPPALMAMKNRGQLPTPDYVESQLAKAWGFNFYLPKAWLLMRFSPWFARGYVDNTERHPTFARVEYGELDSLIAQHVPLGQQALVQQVVATRSSQDVYYAGWVRLGDINGVMRLRDWRPQGEVITPWSLRQQMRKEAQQEVATYGKG
ncbi:MAG: TIGR03985 family CRISPR-associated protein [Leptolyngbya sp. SIOISBB]|nr:TIGR03985 family CRISPR-associated protein [Leptolyngbya sp. SIOISBB]